jgi:N-acyl-L-homoserine lactone synthetase
MQVITPEYYGAFAEEIAEMHRLSYRVFKERLQWDVQVSGDMEIDGFDTLHPVYLVQRASDERIQGCVRLLPSTGPTMLRETFPLLLSRPTYELFAGMIEFGLSRGVTDIVTVTDARMERILRRAGWPLRRFGEPRRLGNTQAVAGNLEVSLENLARVRMAGNFGRPVLWEPVMVAA